MRCIIFAALAVAACDRAADVKSNETNALAAAERHLAETEGRSLPRGWQYRSQRDQVRNYDQRLATLASDDSAAVIGVQSWPDTPPTVFFRAARGSFDCFDPCGIAVSVDGRQGRWSGVKVSGETIIIHDWYPEALEAVRSARVIIAELPTRDGQPQKTFRVAGLDWDD